MDEDGARTLQAGPSHQGRLGHPASGRLSAGHPAGALCTGASASGWQADLCNLYWPQQHSRLGGGWGVAGGKDREGLMLPAVLTGTLVTMDALLQLEPRQSPDLLFSGFNGEDGGWWSWGLGQWDIQSL